MKIAFILPSNTISGGIYTALWHAAYLSKTGHQVYVSFLHAPKNYVPLLDGLQGLAHMSIQALQQMDDLDFVIATWWETVQVAKTIKARELVYFVQGFEDQFYPLESPQRQQVIETYTQDVRYICVSPALQQRLAQLGVQATIAPPGIPISDFDNALPAIPRRGRLRALVEGMPDQQRKGVHYTLEILQQFTDLEIVH